MIFSHLGQVLPARDPCFLDQNLAFTAASHVHLHEVFSSTMRHPWPSSPNCGCLLPCQWRLGFYNLCPHRFSLAKSRARLWFGLLWSVKLCCESQDHRCHLLLYNSAKLQLHSFLVFRQQSSCLEFSRQHQQNETIKELFEEWQEKYDLILGLPLSYICILDANKTTNYGRPEPWNNTRKAFSFQTALSKSLHSTHTIHTFSLRIVYPSTFAAGSLFSLLLHEEAQL